MGPPLEKDTISVRSVSSEGSTLVTDEHPDIDLPTSFKIYCDKNRLIKSSWYIGPNKATRLKIISCNACWPASLEFHDGVELHDPVIARSRIRNSTIELSIFSTDYVLHSTSTFSAIRSNVDFGIHFLIKGIAEHFTWQRSHDADVKNLGGRGGGWAFVRESTGESVAAYSLDLLHPKLSGRFQFLGSGASGELGKEWAVMTIISALSIGQRKRDLSQAIPTT